MSRIVTLAGYVAIVSVALGLELAARQGGRVATFGEALGGALRPWPMRAALIAGWLWLGWHLFVRVDWR
jgi:hypothetical protein